MSLFQVPLSPFRFLGFLASSLCCNLDFGPALGPAFQISLILAQIFPCWKCWGLEMATKSAIQQNLQFSIRLLKIPANGFIHIYHWKKKMGKSGHYPAMQIFNLKELMPGFKAFPKFSWIQDRNILKLSSPKPQ